MIPEILLKTGDVLLVDGTSWLAKKIQWFQKCKYNHAGLIVMIGDEWYVSEEAKITGICFTPLTEYQNKLNIKGYNVMIKRLRQELSLSQMVQIQELSAIYCNSGHYDFIGTFLRAPLRYLGKALGKDWDTQPNHKKKETFRCSAWVMFALNKVTGLFHNWNDYDPADIYYEDVDFKVVYETKND